MTTMDNYNTTCDDCGTKLIGLGKGREVSACTDGHDLGVNCCEKYICSGHCAFNCDICGTINNYYNDTDGWVNPIMCTDCKYTFHPSQAWYGTEPWLSCYHCPKNCYSIEKSNYDKHLLTRIPFSLERQQFLIWILLFNRNDKNKIKIKNEYHSEDDKLVKRAIYLMLNKLPKELFIQILNSSFSVYKIK